MSSEWVIKKFGDFERVKSFDHITIFLFITVVQIINIVVIDAALKLKTRNLSLHTIKIYEYPPIPIH